MLKRRGFTLIELLVVVVIIGILASVALPSFVGAQDKARNSTVQSNMNTVKIALEMYATDYNGTYPEPGNDWMTAYAGGGGAKGGKGGKNRGKKKGECTDCLDGLEEYLPGAVLPASPWGTTGQEMFAKIAKKMKDTEDMAKGDSPTPANTRIGTGQVPPADATTLEVEHYGAISYHYQRSSAAYVMYGTGKKGRDAIVAGAVSNMGQ